MDNQPKIKRNKQRKALKNSLPWVAVERDRAYVMGNVIPYATILKSMGCVYDKRKLRWWLPIGRINQLFGFCNQIAGIKNPYTNLLASALSLPCFGTVVYNGREYYVIGFSGDKLRITDIDGAIDCFVTCRSATWLDVFEPLKYVNLNKFLGLPVWKMDYFTLGEIRSFYLPFTYPRRSVLRRGRDTQTVEDN